MDEVPLHRFEEFGHLSPTERAAVFQLPDRPLHFHRGQVIRPEGIPVNGFYLLLRGWAFASRIMRDGTRQIVKIHLPGDALGTPSIAMRQTAEELSAHTDVEVAKIPLERFGLLFDDHPRVAARFMLSIQQERIALMDRLAAIGRTSAAASLAAFLLDLRDRLIPLKLVVSDGFDMPVTQEQIGDVLGLTGVHVSRVFASFTRQGLVRRRGRTLKINDIDALERLAARPIRQVFPDQSWLPAER